MKTRFFLAAIIVFGVLCSLPIVFEKGFVTETLACDPPPPPPPDVDPNGDPDEQNPDREDNDPNHANDSDDANLADPVLVKDGQFDYHARDVVIKGRAMDVVIERSHRNEVFNGAKAIFDLIITPYPGVTISDVQWEIPPEAYDVLKGTAIDSPLSARAWAEFRLPPGGPYSVRLVVKDRYYLDAWVIRPNPYYWEINGSEYSSWFGHEWDLNYNMKLREFDDPNTIAFFDGHNRRMTFDLKQGSNPPEYTPPAGGYDRLVKDSNGYTMTDKHGKKHQFDTYGHIKAIEDRNGNAITFGYTGDPNNRKLTTIRDDIDDPCDPNDLDRAITLAYPNRGLLSTITDFENRLWTYTYDDENRNNLVSVEGPTNLKTQYTYNKDPGTGPWYHDVNSVTDPNGQTYLVNTYDAYWAGTQLAYRVKKQTYGEGYFEFNYYPDVNRTKFTDRRGYYTNFFYNDAGQITKSKLFTQGLRESDPDSYITKYEYDSNIIEVTKKVLPAGNYITYERDPNSGNILTLAREPNDGDANIVTKFTYDANFNFVKSITDPRQNKTELKYDPNGNLETITYPEVDTPYGSRKKPVYKFTYNSYGQVETITDPCNIIIKYQYYTDSNDANNYGRLWKVVLDPCVLQITYELEYDALGRVKEVADPCGNTWGLTWDDIDRLKEITDPCGNATKLTYNKCKKLEKIEREWSGIIKLGYDILDNLKTITDPCNYVTKLSYDNSANLSDINDAEDNATQYKYDERDLLWRVTDANGGITRFSYTLNGMLADINDANTNGNVTDFHYDGFDRLLWIQYPDDTNEAFGYDKASNVTSWRVRDGNNTIRYEYDELNRLKV
ncbi:MAG: hypothetical protein ACYSU6_07535, partial [Planctomycetota bacterium]